MKYKAFISYRHSENGRRHAVALETALKRYAKPTLSRPIPIFRDEKHMKPEISLPKLIQNGLENSEYLIFLAEKASAQSQWCGEELEYWCNPDKLNRTDRLIIILIDDDIVLNKTQSINFEQSTALPTLLQSYLTSIPLYVDLRWAKTKVETDLQDPKYRHEINALTARLRGVNPEDLNDEELRVFRRNIRLRNGAIFLLSSMILILIFTTWWALEQRNKADKQTILAKDNAAEAKRNLEMAKSEEKRAFDALEQVKTERNAKERERDAAQRNYEDAKKARIEAESNLKKATIANEQVVLSILLNTDSIIRNMDYEAALVKINLAASLKVKKNEVTRRYLEIAFWFNETGKQSRAIAILDTVSMNLGKKKPSESLSRNPKRQQIRKAIENLNANCYLFLRQRYYPHMLLIKGGIFKMGCNPDSLKQVFGEDRICSDEEILHTVALDDYYLAETETTWWQYGLYQVSKGENRWEARPSWNPSADNPVVNVDWYDAVEYANWVSDQFSEFESQKIYSGLLRSDKVEADLSKIGYRLPTEAEWEYASRNRGKDILFAWGNLFNFNGNLPIKNMPESGISISNSSGEPLLENYNDGFNFTAPVNIFQQGNLGLFDMSGNVDEWCWDWHDSKYYKETQVNPSGPKEGNVRVYRGGSWYNSNGLDRLRCSYRGSTYPGNKHNHVGFRLARTAH